MCNDVLGFEAIAHRLSEHYFHLRKIHRLRTEYRLITSIRDQLSRPFDPLLVLHIQLSHSHRFGGGDLVLRKKTSSALTQRRPGRGRFPKRRCSRCTNTALVAIRRLFETVLAMGAAATERVQDAGPRIHKQPGTGDDRPIVRTRQRHLNDYFNAK